MKKSKRTSLVFEVLPAPQDSLEEKSVESTQESCGSIVSAMPHYITAHVDTLNKTRENDVPDPRSPSTQMSVGELRVWLARLTEVLEEEEEEET